MHKLSESRRQILRYLDRRNYDRDGCPTVLEIGKGAHHGQAMLNWAAGTVRAMAKDGQVERVGVSIATNAATWRITEAGREALRAEGGE